MYYILLLFILFSILYIITYQRKIYILQPFENYQYEFIPRIIHQMFSSWNDIPNSCKKVIRHNININDNYQYKFYSDKDINKLLKKDPEMYKMYLKINPDYGACRSDFVRYYLLYKFGGVYIDIKAKINENLDKYIQKNRLIILEDWKNSNIKNQYAQWFLAYPKNHILMRLTLEKLKKNLTNDQFYNLTGKDNVLRISGPICYYDAIHPYLGKIPHKIIKKKGPWFNYNWQRNLFVYYDGTFGKYHRDQKKKK